MSRFNPEESTPVSQVVADRRARQLAAARHYRSLWDILPQRLQMLATLAAATCLHLPEPLIRVLLAIFN